jgi:hypothetical protein
VFLRGSGRGRATGHSGREKAICGTTELAMVHPGRATHLLIHVRRDLHGAVLRQRSVLVAVVVGAIVGPSCELEAGDEHGEEGDNVGL